MVPDATGEPPRITATVARPGAVSCDGICRLIWPGETYSRPAGAPAPEASDTITVTSANPNG